MIQIRTLCHATFRILYAQQRLAAVMQGFSEASDSLATSAAVGSIVGLHSESIQQMASEYAEKVGTHTCNTVMRLFY